VKLLSVVGNRPQFIKSAPLSVALRAQGLAETVVHTGQHYDRLLSRVFFDELDLREPAFSLDLRTADVDVMRRALAAVVGEAGPHAVLVFGDTNSTLAGALAADAAGIPVAHVEAGLRSGDLTMPEERNRIAVDRVADILFAPDERSRLVLASEKVRGEIHVVGDVMADALRIFRPIAERRAPPPWQRGSYVLATVHREANVSGRRLRRIVEGLNGLTERVVLPLHPRTREALRRDGLDLSAHIVALEPVGYLELISLTANARVVVTDSGGLQKEAFWHGVPCVTLRPSTEWVDTVETGANVLVDDDPELLVAAVSTASMPDLRPVLYGDGYASERIAAALAARR
jgi:UDP-N-acetylglucosamine 2-epimerase